MGFYKVYILAFVLLFCNSAFGGGDYRYDDDIQKGFRQWVPAGGAAKTALSYAEYLASQNDTTLKKQAQAIVFRGAGFGGFAKNRTANDHEMGQYFSVFEKIKGLEPFDEEYLGEVSLEKSSYHAQAFALFMQRYIAKSSEAFKFDFASGDKVLTLMWCSGVMGEVFSKKYLYQNTLRWVGQYEIYKSESARRMFEVLRTSKPVGKAACIYGGYYSAVPHVHSYNSERRPNFGLSLPDGRLVAFADFGFIEGKGNLLFRPHAYLGSKFNIPSGGRLDCVVNATLHFAAEGSMSIAGLVSIHDKVASPDTLSLGVKSIERPFISKITNIAPVHTLHIPTWRSGAPIGNLNAEEIGSIEALVGYIFCLYPKEEDRAFILRFLEGKY